MTSDNNRRGIMVAGFSPLPATTTAAALFRRRHAHNGPLLLTPPQRSLCHAEQSGLRGNDRLLLRAAPTTELNSSGNNADFAHQELKVLLDAMRRSNVVRLRDVSTETAAALVSYVTQVATTRRRSNRPCMPNDNLLASENQEIVWRLAMTTEAALPRDATVLITFPAQSSSSSSSTHQDLVYSLAFGTQTLGLNRLDVACQYTIATSTYDALPIVTYTYQSLTMDAFGYENIDLCLFGMWIKGRTAVLHTAYIDESLWIERVIDIDSDSIDRGDTNTAAWNVYVRSDSDSDPSW
jgi:hypothetical protein